MAGRGETLSGERQQALLEKDGVPRVHLEWGCARSGWRREGVSNSLTNVHDKYFLDFYFQTPKMLIPCQLCGYDAA